MERLINNSIRPGNFTSSEIVALMKGGTRPMTESEMEEYKKNNPKGRRTTIDVMFGDAAMTYIEECNMERRLGRSLDNETNSHPTSWGNIVEERAFSLLGTEYKISSQETFQHKEFSFWCGSPDGNKFDEGKTVFDIKCPMTLKSFCQLVQPLYDGFTGMEAMNKIRELHKDGDKYYSQLVSNSILTESKFAELIVYVPYQQELVEIRDATANYDGNQNKVAWIQWAEDNDLPYILSGGYYKNINIIRFEVPEEDKIALTERVVAAGVHLIKSLR